MESIYIIDFLRSPFTEIGGAIGAIKPSALMASIIGGLTNRNASFDIDKVIIGNALTGGVPSGFARRCAIASNLKKEVSTLTVSKGDSTGLAALQIGDMFLRSGQGETALIGALAHPSTAPHYLFKRYKGGTTKEQPLVDSLLIDGYLDYLHGSVYGLHIDEQSILQKLNRKSLDHYSSSCYESVRKAYKQKLFERDLLALNIQYNEVQLRLHEDEAYKSVALNKITELKPLFSPTGLITAANSAALSDGGVGMLLASEKTIEKNKISPKLKIKSILDLGFDEHTSALDIPIKITEKILEKSKLKIKDIDCFEIHDPFASFPVHFSKVTKVEEKKLNQLGGSVAFGNPLGVGCLRGVMNVCRYLLNSPTAKYGLGVSHNIGNEGIGILIEKVN